MRSSGGPSMANTDLTSGMRRKFFKEVILTAEDKRQDYGETRLISLGLLEDLVVVVVYTERGEKIRLISMRKANQKERKAYEEKILFGRAALRNLKDEEIDYSDIPELDEAFFEQAVIVLPQPKASVCIRLDREVLDWFKAQGKGYQPRINALLRAYMEAQSKG